MSLLVLSASDVEQVISSFSPEELLTLMAEVFSLLSSSSTTPSSFSPHRTTIPSPSHTTLFMPSRINHIGTSLKVVSVPTSSSDSRGLPASSLVLDEDTGAVKAIVNARSLTALRNAAGSLLSTRLVGPETPSAIVAFGAGRQIESHIDLHLRSFSSIQTCTIINRSLNSRVAALQTLLQTRFPDVKFQCLQSSPSMDATNNTTIEEHVRNASIIVCATPSTAPLFPSSWVHDGTHVILIGSYTPQMHEVDRELVQRACIEKSNSGQGHGRGMLLVDSREACLKEAGELIDAGLSDKDMVEIGELVRFDDTGKVDVTSVIHDSGERTMVDENLRNVERVRGEGENEGGVTIFKSVGIGLQDVAIVCAVVKRVEETGLSLGATIADYDTQK